MCLAFLSSPTQDYVYLNAGLMAGTAKNLIQLIDATQIGGNEDDQAVLTDYMYHNKDSIIMDNRGGKWVMILRDVYFCNLGKEPVSASSTKRLECLPCFCIVQEELPSVMTTCLLRLVSTL